MTDQQYSDEEIIAMIQRCEEEHGACTPQLFTGMSDTCSVSLVIRRFGSWSQAKQKAGLDDDMDRTGRNRTYSDADVLNNLRECADRNAGKCTFNLLQNEGDLVAPSVAVDRFGSWSDAKRKAGLETDERSTNHRPREYSDEDYFDFIRECYEKHGKATQELFNEEAEQRSDHPTANAVRKRIGSWSEAKAAAGISTDNHEYSDEELIDMLRQCRERYGKVTASVFASDPEFCSPETLQRRFGSWSEAKEQLEEHDLDDKHPF